jgi:hypothetical protein
VKRSRTTRTRRSLPPISERDLDVLSLVGLCRFVTTSQVARDLFPTEDRARRRLRQLFDAKLIAVTLTSSTQPNLISLTKEGHELIKAQRPELAARIRRTGLIRLDELERHLLLVDARLYAAAWGQAHDAPLLRWTNNPTVFPAADALAEFAAGDEIASVAIRCCRPHERGDALERLRVQVEAGVLRAVWLLSQTEASGDRSWFRQLSSVAMKQRPINGASLIG